MTPGPAGPAPEPLAPAARPPFWLIAATGLLAAGSLAMAVAETSLWMHYLIDAGESISLVGVAFILGAGLFLFRRRRLLVSLPLAVPWLLFPVITQGDQIIDNLSIAWMRIVCHVLLGLLFGTPVAILVVAVRHLVAPARGGTAGSTAPSWLAVVPGVRQLAEGRTREGAAMLGALLLAIEMWVAAHFLGELMVVTLLVMIWGTLVYGSRRVPEVTGGTRRSEQFALGVLIGGVVLSVGLFFGFKNRPGAYQGSPSYFMDPAQAGAGFRLDRVPVPLAEPQLPADASGVRLALATYAHGFARLVDGYYILDRNYNYNFHNELFLRNTPLLPSYRQVGLGLVAEAVRLRESADAAAAGLSPAPDVATPIGALLADVRAYAMFTFDRAPTLEQMSASFERTKAGLQHATHLYEGEGKVVGVRLDEIMTKHARVLSAPATRPVTEEFANVGHAVYRKYANRIVGF